LGALEAGGVEAQDVGIGLVAGPAGALEGAGNGLVVAPGEGAPGGAVAIFHDGDARKRIPGDARIGRGMAEGDGDNAVIQGVDVQCSQRF
jgi:hypothetical protein